MAKAIENLNQPDRLNQAAGVEWKLLSFEEKRTLGGFKGRIEWCHSAKELRVTLKLSFAHNYFRLANQLSEGDLIAEL